MSPVESMACGTPVIGVNDGGLKESIVDGQSGILIDAECQPNDIINAISHINTSPLDATSCVQRGEYFSLKKFELHLKKLVNGN